MRIPLVAILTLLLSNLALGQVTYQMQNATVDDCEGILTDSDNKQLPGPGETGHYDHNENFTFSICLPVTGTIELNFSEFCSEDDLDVISFYDGPDANSPFLFSHSGTSIPPTVVATSGCLTIVWETDASKTCTGWIAEWDVIPDPPDPPEFLPSPNQTCSTTVFQLELDIPIPCDSVVLGNFSIGGPANPTIQSVSPINCTNGETSTIEIVLNGDGLSESGFYTIRYSFVFVDICGNEYPFDVDGTVLVDDCPIFVDIAVNPNPVCEGECARLRANPRGGDLNYTYQWSTGETTRAITVCPTQATSYSVTVDDGGPASANSTSVTVDVLPAPEAGDDIEVCQNDNPTTLAAANPPGGFWVGNGIINPSGVFDPSQAINDPETLYYTAPNGCVDSILVDIIQIDAGNDTAACVSNTPFQIDAIAPNNGTWSGPNITANGMFTPSTAGQFTVVYTSPEGCTDEKVVIVEQPNIPASISVCSNESAYQIQFSPQGGVWSGPGIIDDRNGIVNATQLAAGNYTLVYTQANCQFNLPMTVIEIDAGQNIVTCPFAPSFTLTGSPAGGTWTGPGVNSATNEFDPNFNGGNNFNQFVFYELNGCIDSIRIRGINTRIVPNQLELCQGIDILDLNSVQVNPQNGTWAGPGVVNSGNGDFSFSASLAGGPGSYLISYEANTCQEQISVIVHPSPIVQTDTGVCENTASFLLQASPTGGVWSGTGISNQNSGEFNPNISGLGNFNIIYTDQNGCQDSLEVSVISPTDANIAPAPRIVCYTSTPVNLSASPVGGSFQGPGIQNNQFFPNQAGPGVHLIYYQFGSGSCATTDSVQIEVLDSLDIQFNFTDTIICFGSGMDIIANISGGQNTTLGYNWNPGSSNSNILRVLPQQSDYYFLTVSDNCSDDAIDSVYIELTDSIQYNLILSDTACFGDSVIVSVEANGQPYQFQWQTQGGIIAESIELEARTYRLRILDTIYGCFREDFVQIPSYPPINAAFNILNATPCIPISSGEIEAIDLSSGGHRGTWELRFMDTTVIEDFWLSNVNFLSIVQDTGTYFLTQSIENEFGCIDSITKPVCLAPNSKLYFPEAFTPNNDGNNDVWKPVLRDINQYELVIINRWGEIVFSTTDPNQGWDGRVRNQLAPQDSYTFIIKYSTFTKSKLQREVGAIALVR